jgi:hypothetical protein
MDREQAQRIVYETIDVVNQQLPAAKRLRKSPATVIAGPGGALDSLGVITFVITLEDKVGEAVGTSVQLLDRDVLGDGSPLQTVAALTEFVATAAQS